jgi:hypothetical protein
MAKNAGVQMRAFAGAAIEIKNTRLEGGTSMMPFHDERDSAEIRLMRSVVELNHRIWHTPSASERTALRTTLTVLRAELVKLIEAMPIFSEDDVARASTVHGLSPMLISAGMPRGPS